MPRLITQLQRQGAGYNIPAHEGDLFGWGEGGGGGRKGWTLIHDDPKMDNSSHEIQVTTCRVVVSPLSLGLLAQLAANFGGFLKCFGYMGVKNKCFPEGCFCRILSG